MKIKGRKKFDIQKIFIEKNNKNNGCIISLICNNQFIELYSDSDNILDIFDRIIKYLDIISNDDIYYKI